MIKKIGSAAFILLCALFVFSSGNRVKAPQPEKLNADDELRIKQSMLQQDVQLTRELCQTQCSLDFRDTLRRLKSDSNPAKAKQLLNELRDSHDHMQYLELYTEQGTKRAAAAGELPKEARPLVERALNEARSRVQAGSSYESDTIGEGEHQYMVLGVPSESGDLAMVGIVHQDLLHKVAIDLRKNLRLVPYPSDKRFKIESVDSRTLEDVKVDHPEQNEGTSHYHVNQIVVKFRAEPSQADLTKMEKDISGKFVQKLGYTYVFESSSLEAKQLMDYFQAWNVEYAEPHFLYMTNETAEAAPNDSLYARYQWNLPAIETIPGWDVSRGSQDVLVAVIDTGVDYNHPDLKDRVVNGLNVFEPDKAPMDDVGHGTHVAGVISALVNNGEGVAGMSWFNNILPIKVLDSTGAGSTYSVAQGIIWATDQGAKVINMSLGNYAEASFLHDAIRYAYDRDVVLVAASGNDNTIRPGYPAAYPEVFAVAATDSQGNKATFSNYGDYIDVAAPGVNIASTYPNDHYAALSGTSMASPHVTALAALIRSANPLLTNVEVMDIMRQTANDLGDPGKDPYYGYGQIDVAKALAMAVQSSQSLTFWEQWFDRELERIAEGYR